MNEPPTGRLPAPPPDGQAGGPPSSSRGVAGAHIVVKLFGRTDVGQIREHNEDNFLVADLTKKTRSLLEADRTYAVGPNGTVFGVCDGMGGAAAGEVASQLAVDIIVERMSEGGPPVNRDEFAHRLVAAVEAAGLRIFTEAKVDRARRGMGTTATIAGLIDDHLFLAQVGDSRGYILRGDRLVQVTRDQSLVNQLIEAGQLTEAEAETFEHNNIILQALGTADTVNLTTVGTPSPQVSETRITRAEAPRLLEYSWGGNDLRWELEPSGEGTRLTLWHNIDRRYVAMGAAGWQICLDVLDRFIDGHPIGRIVAGDAMKFGWQRLHTEYAKQFGTDEKV